MIFFIYLYYLTLKILYKMMNYENKELEKKMIELSISFGVRIVSNNGNRADTHEIIEDIIYTLLGHLKPEQITKEMVIDLTKLHINNVHFLLSHTREKFTIDEANEYKDRFIKALEYFNIKWH